jgi:hypothetical protein
MEEEMIRSVTKQILTCALSCLLVISAVPFEIAGQESAPPNGYSGQGAPLFPDELQQLVAPIALFPDALVAQILGGATFPDQIAAANNFLQINKRMLQGTPFHGYYFRMLQGQTDKARDGEKNYGVDGRMTGGFAFIAYPAEYGNSGVMAFMINQDGVPLQKDLGKTTEQTARQRPTLIPIPDGVQSNNNHFLAKGNWVQELK